MNPLKMLWEDFGQAVWLDYIERDLVRGDGLATLIAEDGVRGVTSNPSIFKQAIAGGDSYDEQIDSLLDGNPEITTVELYEALAVQDIRMAADALRPVYDISKGYDGYVSLEVSPHLARDTAGTVAETHRAGKINLASLHAALRNELPEGAKANKRGDRTDLNTARGAMGYSDTWRIGIDDPTSVELVAATWALAPTPRTARPPLPRASSVVDR